MATVLTLLALGTKPITVKGRKREDSVGLYQSLEGVCYLCPMFIGVCLSQQLVCDLRLLDQVRLSATQAITDI